jgi:hypothetical protein
MAVVAVPPVTVARLPLLLMLLMMVVRLLLMT